VIGSGSTRRPTRWSVAPRLARPRGSVRAVLGGSIRTKAARRSFVIQALVEAAGVWSSSWPARRRCRFRPSADSAAWLRRRSGARRAAEEGPALMMPSPYESLSMCCWRHGTTGCRAGETRGARCCATGGARDGGLYCSAMSFVASLDYCWTTRTRAAARRQGLAYVDREYGGGRRREDRGPAPFHR